MYSVRCIWMLSLFLHFSIENLLLALPHQWPNYKTKKTKQSQAQVWSILPSSTARDQLRGSNSDAGKMDQTWSKQWNNFIDLSNHQIIIYWYQSWIKWNVLRWGIIVLHQSHRSYIWSRPIYWPRFCFGWVDGRFKTKRGQYIGLCQK